MTPPTFPPSGPYSVTATRGVSRNRVTRSVAPSARGITSESTWWSGTIFDMAFSELAPGPLRPRPLHHRPRRPVKGNRASARESELALCDDVRLPLRRPAGDRSHPRPQKRLRPAAALDGVPRVLHQEGIRSTEGETQLVHALGEARPEELHERRFRTRLLASLEAGEGAAGHQPHDLDGDPRARDLLADPRIARAAPTAPERRH